MSIGDPYATTAELKTYLAINDSDDDTLLLAAVTTASDWVSRYCNRQFNQETAASARVFTPRDGCLVIVDDFYTTTGLIVATDTADDGTYATTWTSSDYQLEPVNGTDAGVTGVPYYKIRAIGSLRFPCVRRPAVKVTAKWGWTAVPASVKRATLILGGYLHNIKDSPLGVASFGDAGLIRVRDVPQVAMLLEHYVNPVASSGGPLVA